MQPGQPQSRQDTPRHEHAAGDDGEKGREPEDVQHQFEMLHQAAALEEFLYVVHNPVPMHRQMQDQDQTQGNTEPFVESDTGQPALVDQPKAAQQYCVYQQ